MSKSTKSQSQPPDNAIVVRVPAYHQGQRRIKAIADACRVAIAICGRRFGKTFFGVKYAFEQMVDAQGEFDVLWAAPSYKLTLIAWDEFQKWFGPAIIRESKSEHWIEIVNGARIWFGSSDNPASLRGRGYNLVILDECAWISQEAYFNVIIPALADRDGRQILITTPAGRRGWVYEEYCRAVNKEEGYGFAQLPSWENPNPAIQKFIDFRRRKMPAAIFAQEFGAEFLEDAAALFRGLDRCLGGMPEEPQPEMPYVAGCDLAKAHAWSVAVIMRINVQPFPVVDVERFHQQDWPKQIEKFDAISKRWNRCPLVIDSTGVGDPVYDFMMQRGMPVRGYKFTGDTAGGRIAGSRTKLFDNAALAVQEQRVRIPHGSGLPENFEILVNEMRSMAIDIDDEGRTVYRSRGEFYDCAVGFALAWEGTPHSLNQGVNVVHVKKEELSEAAGGPGEGTSILYQEY